MTTIDVNTGGYVGKRDFSDTVFKTNLEAAQTIARQLRLRNLGGIIIVDFIDMSCDEHREAVLAELRRSVSTDRTRMTVSNFTELGLVEMTRKRTRESLAHVLCEPCPMCLGAIYWARLDKMYYGNNKTDAKNIGFDDSFIYDELELKPEDRKLPSEILLHNEALTAFKAWAAKEDRVEY